jgi:hypothetical protein
VRAPLLFRVEIDPLQSSTSKKVREYKQTHRKRRSPSQRCNAFNGRCLVFHPHKGIRAQLRAILPMRASAPIDHFPIVLTEHWPSRFPVPCAIEHSQWCLSGESATDSRQASAALPVRLQRIPASGCCDGAFHINLRGVPIVGPHIGTLLGKGSTRPNDRMSLAIFE